MKYISHCQSLYQYAKSEVNSDDILLKNYNQMDMDKSIKEREDEIT